MVYPPTQDDEQVP
jgi:hypothetical protein